MLFRARIWGRLRLGVAPVPGQHTRLIDSIAASRLLLIINRIVTMSSSVDSKNNGEHCLHPWTVLHPRFNRPPKMLMLPTSFFLRSAHICVFPVVLILSYGYYRDAPRSLTLILPSCSQFLTIIFHFSPDSQFLLFNCYRVLVLRCCFFTL